MRPLRIVALGCALLASPPAGAGYWNYGCKGSIGNSALVFDRQSFLIMPKSLAAGDIKGLSSDQIFTFDADDNNSGFLPVMKFSRGAYPDQQVVLTEKSSKVISQREGNVGPRGTTTTLLRKTYRFQRLGWTESPDAEVTMECIEYLLTAR